MESKSRHFWSCIMIYDGIQQNGSLKWLRFLLLRWLSLMHFWTQFSSLVIWKQPLCVANTRLLTRLDDTRIPTYSKLKSLHLDSCCCNTWKYVTSWLTKSPQLETIVFNEGIADTCRTEHEHEWRPSMELAPFSSNVKTIEVHRFEGGKMELLLLNYLLENAGVLKRLILYKCGTMTMEEELEGTAAGTPEIGPVVLII
ncbi:uncharacterized protein LOC141640396 isoform X2 [Silene latifolia]|uniref:uncharacterized protein LOC141640396 isoform X2 n=1 Tax=Silene latifolia TaxID=37657 RepID=UPI003D77B9C1